MKTSSTIGVAFLGVGRMGETHLRNLGGLSDVQVIVVADPNLQSAENGKRLSGAESATTDPEAAINHPLVDAVVIVTPTDTHARLIELAVRAGKAVFSEKPIALDLTETKRERSSRRYRMGSFRALERRTHLKRCDSPSRQLAVGKKNDQ